MDPVFDRSLSWLRPSSWLWLRRSVVLCWCLWIGACSRSQIDEERFLGDAGIRISNAPLGEPEPVTSFDDDDADDDAEPEPDGVEPEVIPTVCDAAAAGVCVGRSNGQSVCDGNRYVVCGTTLAGCPYEARAEVNVPQCGGPAVPENCAVIGDEDGDGRADCSDTDCFSDPRCLNTRPPENCSVAGDEDGDGLADCGDPDCAADVRCLPPENCGVAGDEDRDGRADCADPDCALDTRCAVERCGVVGDEDRDGLADCNDPDCAGQAACRTEEICGNGIDDNQNGATDCADAACASGAACRENCSDGVDNNQNGLVDCADPSCVGVQGCPQCPATTLLGSTIGTAVATGSTQGAGSSVESQCAVSQGAPDRSFSWIAPTSGCYEFSTDGSSFDTVLSLRNACPDLTERVCDDDNGGDGSSSLVQAALNAGQAYVIAVDGYGGGDSGDFQLNIRRCVESCGNGRDDDLDGRADCLDQDCGGRPECGAEDCANGADDNGDGLADCDDPSCFGSDICVACPATDINLPSTVTVVNAISGGGNDVSASCGDGSPGPDTILGWVAPETGCYEIYAPNEGFPSSLHVHEACPVFAELDCTDEIDINFGAPSLRLSLEGGRGYAIVVDGVTPDAFGAFALIIQACSEDCTNGVDDDRDGASDCLDYDCVGTSECLTEICNNRRDDDRDGRIDCADADCLDSPLCEEDCQNGVDDNGDGAIDCADALCSSTSSCEEICGDGEDNDGDRLIDCADPECETEPECLICAFTQDLGSSVGDAVASGSTVGGYNNFNPTCAASSTAADVVFNWVAPATGCFRIDTAGSEMTTYDSVLQVRSACPDFAALACDDDDGPGNTSYIELDTVGGRNYSIVVDGYGTRTGEFVLNINLLSSGPCSDE